MILFGFFVFFRYGSGVLDGQKRISSGVDECDEVGDGDEIDRASGYGGIVPDLMISLSSQHVMDLSRREAVVHLIG
ncbi:hypothetical protein ACFX1Z_037359 [Malus domestica]